MIYYHKNNRGNEHEPALSFYVRIYQLWDYERNGAISDSHKNATQYPVFGTWSVFEFNENNDREQKNAHDQNVCTQNGFFVEKNRDMKRYGKRG